MEMSDFPKVVPMIAYEDGHAAIEWLTRVLGFEERLRFESEDGSIGHAELELEGGLIMLATPTPEYVGPKRHRETCEAARRWSDNPYVIDGVLVSVSDVDGHFERARAAGATILREPEDQPFGDRLYTVEDLEGHRWMFSQHVRDVSPEEWRAQPAASSR
jgi:uncharacterized glyoxalase superfamily protein PhnB